MTNTLTRHRKFGVCTVAGNSVISGAEFISLRFANGFVHFPVGVDLLADLSEVVPLQDKEGEPLSDRTGALRYPPLTRLGLDAEIGGDSDMTLPPRKDADDGDDTNDVIGELAA